MNSPSNNITIFLDFLTEAQKQYKFCYDEMTKQEQLTQDFLHSLELDDLKRNERSKLATKLAVNRKDRRYYKDRVEEYEPIVQFLNDPNNKKVFDKLSQVLGQMRKAESYHKYRKYVPKVKKEEEKL